MTPVSRLENAQYRLAHYYLKRLRAAESAYLRGHEHSTAALALFDQDWSHIKRWRDWSAAHSADHEEIAALCKEFPQAGFELFMLRQHPQERLEWLDVGLAAARRLGDLKAEMVHLWLMGRTQMFLGSPNRAIECAEQALALAQQMDDTLYVCKCLRLLGGIFYGLDEYERSRVANEQAFTLSRDLDAKREMGAALNGLGNVALSQSDNALAYSYYLQYLEIAEAHGQLHEICVALHNLSLIMLRMHDDHLAAVYAERSVALCRAIGFQRFLSESLSLLGDLEMARNHLPEARGHFEESLAVARLISNFSGEASALNNLGSLFCQLGDYQAALEHFEAALSLSQKIEERWFGAIALMYIVRVFRRMGKRDDAVLKLREGLEVVRTLQSSAIRAKYILEAALLWCDQGRVEQAAIWAGLLQGHMSKLDAAQRGLYRELHQRLAGTLSPDELAVHMQRGASGDLYSETDGLLQELMLESSPSQRSPSLKPPGDAGFRGRRRRGREMQAEVP